MAKVLGLGGVFLKVENRSEISTWYSEVFGMDIHSWGGCVFDQPVRSPSVWALFDPSTTYFDPSPHPVMINLIVDDLDGVLARAQERASFQSGGTTSTTMGASPG